jgi:CO/xanthine dehydrogenase FAD-binding subunit
MQAFAFASPTTLKEAVALLADRWGVADILAGGTRHV